MSYIIKETDYYLPERIITNEFLAKECGIDPTFLEEKVGIHKRHVAADDETISDMACKAAEKILNDNGVSKGDIDFLLLCTQNPDYKLPTTACIIQDRLGIPDTCFSVDINMGCSGYVYALIMAGNFLKAQNRGNALIIMADQYSKIIDYKDKNTASLFGDASSASLIQQSKSGMGVLDTVWGTDGSNYDKLILHNSGIVRNPDMSDFLYMHGREIFKFSIKVAPLMVNQLLEKNNLKIDDIRYFIFHQANKYMLTEIQKKLSINENQMIIDMRDYGNTVSSTIPIAYKNLISDKNLKKNDLLIFCGFGVGLSWGGILYKYQG